jgi:RNA polymerase sigma-70 factor (ECF subfamily)
VHDPDEPAVDDAVRAVRAGDRDAFAVVVARYQRRMFALAMMMTRDPTGAEEVAQEALVRAFERLHLYDERRPFSPWMATITVRTAQNWMAKRSRMTAREGDALSPDVAATGHADPLEALIVDEGDRQLWRAVSALSAGQRTVVMLRYRQDMSIQEIASALGVTAGTVKTLLFRARQRLRVALGEANAERGRRL